MTTLTRADVAKQAGVNIETLRYYEKRGLIPTPPRSRSNYRLYSRDTLRRLRFVKRAQELGFSLKEIKELLSLRAMPKARSADIRQKVQTKIADVEQKIRSLKAMHKALSALVATCCGTGPVADCPILEALDLEES